MNYKEGTPQDYESLTPKDYEKFPIWKMALNTDGIEGADETWRLPLLEAKNIEVDMVAVYVAFDVIGTNLVGTGLYSTIQELPSFLKNVPSDKLHNITIWHKNEWVWVGGSEGPELNWPLQVKVRPTIYGESGVCFSIQKSGGVFGTRIEQ